LEIKKNYSILNGRDLSDLGQATQNLVEADLNIIVKGSISDLLVTKIQWEGYVLHLSQRHLASNILIQLILNDENKVTKATPKASNKQLL
jgi:hypothetical protein